MILLDHKKHEVIDYLAYSPHNKVIIANENLMYVLLVVIIIKLFMLSSACRGISKRKK